jgi:hypothetical protein
MHTVGTHPRDVVAEAYVMSVAMLLMQDIRLAITAQVRSPPWDVEGSGWRTMEPTPLARTMHQIKNVIPAMGAKTMALRGEKVPTGTGTDQVSVTQIRNCAYNRWERTFYRWGNQISGREMSQKREKQRMCLVVLPDDAGIEFAAR